MEDAMAWHGWAGWHTGNSGRAGNELEVHQWRLHKASHARSLAAAVLLFPKAPPPAKGTGTEPEVAHTTPAEEPEPHRRSSAAGCTARSLLLLPDASQPPTCARAHIPVLFLQQIHPERRGRVGFPVARSGRAPGIGQFRWPCACVGESRNASREKEKGQGLPGDLIREANFWLGSVQGWGEKVDLLGGKTQSLGGIPGLRWWPRYLPCPGQP